MGDDASNAAGARNIWAPWRMEYIRELADGSGGCFLCDCRDQSDKDVENLVLWRGRRCLTVLNKFPYTGGHLLVAPLEHLGELGDLDSACVLEMMALVRDAQEVLKHAVSAQGFNVGINLGRCAGAGLPGHLHVHVVPRWAGDTNFMAVFGDVRVIPESLANMYAALQEAGAQLDLPRAPRWPGEDQR